MARGLEAGKMGSASVVSYMKPQEMAKAIPHMKPAAAVETLGKVEPPKAAGALLDMKAKPAVKAFERMEPAAAAKVVNEAGPKAGALAFEKMQPQQATQIFEVLKEVKPDVAARALGAMKQDRAVEVVKKMEPRAASSLLEQVGPKAAANIVERMPVDQAARVAKTMELESVVRMVEQLDLKFVARLVSSMDKVEAKSGRQWSDKVKLGAGALGTTMIVGAIDQIPLVQQYGLHGVLNTYVGGLSGTLLVGNLYYRLAQSMRVPRKVPGIGGKTIGENPNTYQVTNAAAWAAVATLSQIAKSKIF